MRFTILIGTAFGLAATAAADAAMTTTTSCHVSKVTPTPPNTECQKRGHVAKPDILKTYKAVTQDHCRNICVNSENTVCKAFGYDDKTMECTTYKHILEVMGFTTGASSMVFSDSTCFSKFCPAPSTTTTTTMGTTTTISAPACPTETIQAGPYMDTYGLYFYGRGLTETPNNPGNYNSTFVPKMNSFPGTLKPCQAIKSCANHTDNGFSFGFYKSFDLHYFISNKTWECISYYGTNTNVSYFNVTNDDVKQVFGYTLTSPF